MITEFFINLFFGFMQWVVSLLPTWTAPGELTGLDDSVNGWFGQFAGIGVWVPWTAVAIAFGLVAAAAIFNVGARLVLWLYSVIPVFGNGD
jgi:hypothetical protein